MKILTAIFFITSFAATSLAQENDCAQRSRLVTSDFLHWSNNDIYSFFETEFKDKRIVFLGEADHRDGKSIEVRSELINYMVRKMGFEILLLESNFYELYVMNQFLNESLDKKLVVSEAFRTGTYMGSDNVKTYELISNGQVIAGGLDIVHRSWYARWIIKDFKKSGIKKKLAEEYLDYVRQISQYQDCFSCKAGDIDFNIKYFKSLSSQINDILSKAANHLQRDYLIQLVRNNIQLVDWVLNRGTLGENKLDFMAVRDSAMGKNLSWFIDRYPQKKIIVATSTYHMTHGLAKAKTMVDYINSEALENSCFIPFVSYHGQRAYKMDHELKEMEIISRDQNSLEGQLSQLDKRYVFADLRSSDCLSNLKMTASDVLPNNANWSDHYDCVYFIRKMIPAEFESLSIPDIEYISNKIQKR